MAGTSPPGRTGAAPRPEREGRCHAGVESIPSTLQHAHTDSRTDPMRGGDDAKNAVDLGPGSERTCVDVGHAGCSSGWRLLLAVAILPVGIMPLRHSQLGPITCTMWKPPPPP